MPTRPALVLVAPLSGVLVRIEDVPDPVFAQKLVGDGVSIDPVSASLLAPCDGEVVHVHAASHALTLRAAHGVELLVHIGLDTVALNGTGFTARVKAGDAVRTGQPLIEFDADYVATHAKSLLTQVVVTNPDTAGPLTRATGTVIAGRDPIVTVGLRDDSGGRHASGARGEQQAQEVSALVTVTSETGLHARPAAVLANAARAFQSAVRLERGDRSANARSVVAIMTLEASRGDTIRLVAAGADADRAVASLSAMIADGLGDVSPAVQDGAGQPASVAYRADQPSSGAGEPRGTVATPSPGRAHTADAEPQDAPAGTDPDEFRGVAASPGVAAGAVHRVTRERPTVPEHAADPHGEQRALETALDRARADLRALQAQFRARADTARAGIFEAHESLLADPDLIDAALSAIRDGRSAAWGWEQACTRQADRLAGLSSELLAARANDVRDVRDRVLGLLTGEAPLIRELPEGAILVAEDLAPSDTAALDRARVAGFCTTGGGATSHVAILARALDLPAVVAIDARVLDLPAGTPAVIDGSRGVLRVNPSTTEIARVRDARDRQSSRRRGAMTRAAEAAVTTDGRHVAVLANIGTPAEAARAVESGADGIGLLRSEFLFLNRPAAPGEDEQYEAYHAIAKTLGRDRPLVVRTLDVGGDKPLPYLPMAREDNPFLGERGVRITLDRPDLMRSQIRAILRAAPAGRIAVMFPMIATLAEWRAARQLLEDERAGLDAAAVPVGMMVEVPSAAVSAAQFAREADFFSIGTNDLTQYVLAMDRGHPALAPRVDAMEPAVLQLIRWTVDAAHARGKHAAVCGGMAGEAQAIPLLVGLGVDELSVSVPAIPLVKAQVRTLDAVACRELAARALSLDTAAAVRALCPAGE